MAAITVLRPGMLTTVQDLGRWGRQHLGVPVAGPMDWYSHQLANAIIGNAPDAATLEITLLGPEIVSDAETICAVTGAEFEVMAGDRRIRIGEPFVLRRGERLRFGARLAGMRATLAVSGGFLTDRVLDSRATSLSSRLGAFGGRALRAGDVLPIGESGALGARQGGRPLLLPKGGARLRVLQGPDDDAVRGHCMRDAGAIALCRHAGLEPHGVPARWRQDRSDASAGDAVGGDADGVAAGTGSGCPILLMADRQTTGGYPRIATVITADLPVAGQLAPGDWIEFEICTRRDRGRCAAPPPRGADGGRGVMTFDDALRGAFGDGRVARDAPLAPLTTFKVGGPADWLLDRPLRVRARPGRRLARAFGVPLTMLGGGSNVLVADAGVRGLVVRVHGGEIRLVDATTVRADAGVTINGLVRWTIAHALAGLEAWAGTPGTVGGAVYGNAHFQGRLISELIVSVGLITIEGALARLRAADMEFGYDYSRLHRTREIVVSADFRVHPGEVDALRRVARESLAFRKRTQPLETASAGCIFQNPDPGARSAARRRARRRPARSSIAPV